MADFEIGDLTGVSLTQDHCPLAENDIAARQYIVIISNVSAKHFATDICD
jgi:hypothetical protein